VHPERARSVFAPPLLLARPIAMLASGDSVGTGDTAAADLPVLAPAIRKSLIGFHVQISIHISCLIAQIGILVWRHCQEPFLAGELFHIAQGL
jgi:hypothetical protein